MSSATLPTAEFESLKLSTTPFTCLQPFTYLHNVLFHETLKLLELRQRNQDREATASGLERKIVAFFDEQGRLRVYLFRESHDNSTIDILEVNMPLLEKTYFDNPLFVDITAVADFREAMKRAMLLDVRVRAQMRIPLLHSAPQQWAGWSFPQQSVLSLQLLHTIVSGVIATENNFMLQGFVTRRRHT